ncbi:MAG: DUF2752 domain-containing protein [Lachnospiraceae bacterium]|nr:DUF2752 domain-containing protein [Lachnospiraceae bacterium]
MFRIFFKDDFYKKFNLTCLFLELYLLAYPILVNALSLSKYTFFQCPYKRMTGRNCPYCGGTRTLNAVLHMNFHEVQNVNALIIGVFAFLNIIMRLYLIFTKYKNIRVLRSIDYITIMIMAIYILTIDVFFVVENISLISKWIIFS